MEAAVGQSAVTVLAEQDSGGAVRGLQFRMSREVVQKWGME